MTSNVNNVKSSSPRNSTVSALTMVLGLYQIIAVATFYLILIIGSSSESIVDKSAEFQVPHDELDAAQAKIDQLMQDLEIERVRRREAETKCRVAAAKIHTQSQTLASVTVERDQLMDTMKELAFARSLLANQLLVDSDVDDEGVGIVEEHFPVEKSNGKLRFNDFVDVLVYEEEPSEEQVDSMIDDDDEDSTADMSLCSVADDNSTANMSLCSVVKEIASESTFFDNADDSMVSISTPHYSILDDSVFYESYFCSVFDDSAFSYSSTDLSDTSLALFDKLPSSFLASLLSSSPSFDLLSSTPSGFDDTVL